MSEINIMDYAIDGYTYESATHLIGIFGNPIKHTLSPVIHNNVSKMLDIAERYIPFHITRDLGQCINCAYNQNILGLNVTVPYKQEVMPYLVEIDYAAKVIGAVNTLVRVEGGYKGYNTDMPGLAKAIFSEGISLEDKKIVMFGAGGAARAVAYMCVKYGASRVYIINRTFENAQIIASDMNKTFDTDIVVPFMASDYRDIPKDEYIFIQCTSVGLHQNDGLPLVEDETFYSMAQVGIDLIYNPSKTPFLTMIEKKGGKIFNGLKMLLYQGILAYELWNDIKVPENVVEEVYKKLTKAAYKDNIVLVGYMGSGKSSVGKAFAKKYGYNFIDTDELIVQREGTSINEIFSAKGEEYFRKLETELIEELQDNLSTTVVATGGGLPMREINRKILRNIGKVIYLMADSDTTYKRVSGNNERPLLNCDDQYNKICNMLEERMPKYKLAADVIVETDANTIEQLVDIIKASI